MSQDLYQDLEVYVFDGGRLERTKPITESETYEKIKETINNLESLLREARQFEERFNAGTLEDEDSLTLLLDSGDDVGYAVSALGRAEK